MAKNNHTNGAPEGLEATLWAAADKLRGNVDAAEYKHVVLGLIFLKYISDSFHEVHQRLQQEKYANPEDPEEYLAANTFWVPEEARWPRLQSKAKSPEIGILIDNAMAAIERDNAKLKGILPQNYGREELDKRRLGELVDLIGSIALGTEASRSQDILGRVYEYFLGQFTMAEGKKGGEFYTPKSIVRLLVEMLEPYHGRVYDPCCGSGGMFVQSEKFIAEHGGRLDDISIFGQESNATTRRLCLMNLAIRGIDSNIGTHAADTFHENLHPDLRANFVLANPFFNDSDWDTNGVLANDPRWHYGVPPRGNANFAWVQHIIYHLTPTGRAGIVLANGSMSTQTSGEGEIRRNLVQADRIDCMVALPPQLFSNTQIPACLWFINKAKPEHRRGQILFIDARKMGFLVSRTLRELSDDEISAIVHAYHNWRVADNGYEDIPGFCASAVLDGITQHNHVLTPGRYVGAAETEDNGEPFAEKMERLSAELREQFATSNTLEQRIRVYLTGLDFYV